MLFSLFNKYICYFIVLYAMLYYELVTHTNTYQTQLTIIYKQVTIRLTN